MKRVLLLCTSHNDLGLIRALRKLGYWIIATGNREHSFGEIWVDKWIKADYSNKELILLESEEKRKQTYARLLEYRVHARKYFYPLTSDVSCFKNKYRSIPLVTFRDYASKVLVLPFYADLEMKNVECIAELI